MSHERVAVVTGGASGLGRATAELLGASGVHVIVGDLSREPKEPGEPPTDERITASGGSARFAQVDVTSTASVEALVASIRAEEGRIDVLVNNAGRFGPSTLLGTDDETWETDMALNLRSQFLVSRSVMPTLLEQEPDAEGVRGRIVNVSSQLGITAAPHAVTYGVAKAGVAQLTRQLAVDFASEGIVVNAVAPGRIITGTHPGERDYLDHGTIDEATRFSLSRTPFPRLGRPIDVARAVRFLASPECTFVSGHVLAVDGGWLAY
ncbi:SDR family NAD(P)-dependent oxidoreductase [Microbacterium testaceum]|uniref:SDR family NAD(P)-dependent oxidoreductase n=1 Tax=Microbacterium testaceum TaxID=2033 RepID=UPI000734D726|nr:SDR family oxidoreductase [Microbacterium testaceum]KTS05707.1 hypothetical protein NS283_05165 [Microbacterium testaceum]